MHGLKRPINSTRIVDEGLAEDPVGTVFMIDLISFMLEALKAAFKVPAVDPLSIQMRLDRINSDASAFSNTLLKEGKMH